MRTLVLLAFATSACASLPAPSVPLVPTPEEARQPVPPLAEAQAPDFPHVRELRHGASRLWLVNDHERSGLTLRVQTRRGEDGGQRRELTSFTARMLAHRLEELLPTANVQGGANIHGAFLQVNTSAGQLRDSLNALHAVLDGAAPPERLVDPARQRLFRAIAESDESPNFAATVAARDELSGRASHLEDGQRDLRPTIASFDVNAVDACRRERFAPQDRILIAVGRYDSHTMRREFERVFGNLEPGPERAPSRLREPVVPHRAALSHHAFYQQAYVTFARSAPHPRDEDRLPYELLVDLVGGSFGSQLNGSLRETHSYTYGAHASIDPSRDSDVLMIRAAFRPADVEAALHDLFDELRRLPTEAQSEARIAGARARLWARTRERLESRGGMATLLGEAYAQRLTPAQLGERYRALADITPEELQAVARRRFGSQQALIVIMGNFEEVSGFLVERNNDGFHLSE